MKFRSSLIWVFLLMFCFTTGFSQLVNNPIEMYRMKSDRTTKAGMYTLGSWAVGNLAVGTYGWINNEGEKKYFHQMNALWNTVNLGLAISGLIGTNDEVLSEESLLQRDKRLERILLINGGLDLLYIGGGILLQNIEHEDPQRQDQYNGYGKSLVLQGGFLLVFDLVLFGIKKSQRKNYQKKSALSTGIGTAGIYVSYTF